MGNIERLEPRYLLSAKVDSALPAPASRAREMGPAIYVQSVVAEPTNDGRLLVAGTTSNAPYGARPGEQALFIMRYNADGTRDSEFGGNGKVEKQHPGLAAVRDVIGTPDGRILVLEDYDGTHDGPAAGQYWALYSAEGIAQRSFGENGLAPAPQRIDARQFISGNKLVMAYQTGDFTRPDSAKEFIAVMNPDGTADQSFGGGNVDTGLSAAKSIRVQTDGKILIVGMVHVHSSDTTSDTFQPAITRVNPDGTKDDSFTNVGPAPIQDEAFAQATVLGSGKIVESSISGADGAKVVTLHRYLPDAMADSTGTNEQISEGALRVAALPEGHAGSSGGRESQAQVGASLPTAWVLGQSQADAVRDTPTTQGAGAKPQSVDEAAVLAGDREERTLRATVVAPRARAGETKVAAHPGKAVLTKNGTLDVQGTDGDDQIRVRRSGEQVIVGINKSVQSFARAKVKRVAVRGGPGNDSIALIGNLRQGYVLGGPGDDTIVGGDEDDVLTGGAGNDLIFGGRGNDRINGGGGRDTLYGGEGNDRIYGGPGNDAIDGGPGANTIDGGEGADQIMNVTKEDEVVSDRADSISGAKD